MDYSYILLKAVPDYKRLIDFGFEKQDNSYILKQSIPNEDFYTIITITSSNITALVYDNETQDRYALFDMISANGAFIGELRSKVKNLLDKITESCFIISDIKSKYESHILQSFECTQDYPWGGDEYTVFRCSNSKWFALIMYVPYKSLGKQSEEKVWVVNLKAESNQIEALIDNKSILPAYHMNKKHWITVVLTSVTDYSLLCNLTEQSYNLINKQKRRKS